MKKELQSKLKAIAIEILSNEPNINVEQLKQQAAEIYENLTILAYLDSEAENTSTKEEVKIEPPKPTIDTNQPPVEQNFYTHDTAKKTTPKLVEEKNTEPTEAKPEIKNEQSPNLLYELDELTAGFENLPEFEPAPENTHNKENVVNSTQKTKASLNDSLKKTIQIGLNDRIAFVKHLFGGNLEDYSRVISQLNTLHSANEATNFINQMVKPEYNNWEGKEAIEERFINVVFCKFEA